MKTKPFSVAPHLFISKCGASRDRCHFVCLKMPQPAGLACGGTDATVADECHGAGSGRHCAGGGSFFFKIRWVDHPYCSTSSSRLRTHINSVEFLSPQKTEPCFTFHLLYVQRVSGTGGLASKESANHYTSYVCWSHPPMKALNKDPNDW